MSAEYVYDTCFREIREASNREETASSNAQWILGMARQVDADGVRRLLAWDSGVTIWAEDLAELDGDGGPRRCAFVVYDSAGDIIGWADDVQVAIRAAIIENEVP